MAEAAQPEVRLRGFLSKWVALRFFADPASGSAADACPRPRLARAPRLAGPLARLAKIKNESWRFLLEQICRPHFQSLGSLPDREQGCILQPPLHAAYKGPVDAHPFRNRLLAQAKGQPESARVPSKGLANIHPQDRRQSRILALRVIIRGRAAPIVAAEFRVCVCG